MKMLDEQKKLSVRVTNQHMAWSAKQDPIHLDHAGHSTRKGNVAPMLKPMLLIEEGTLHLQLNVWPTHMSIVLYGCIFKGGARVSTFPAPLKGTIAHKRPSVPAGLQRRALRAEPPYRRLKIPEASRRPAAGKHHTTQHAKGHAAPQ
ncbi:hypothetical protein EYF80_010408 [Liparis tanakae]|uniref:Uncharacterized protein n=1 Tax=Liparis tanakae TaxID=230148 RepID=A0A4Z2IPJ7_9TELE|nr:hypothetical protein EYF80_010408 [Liparis tanakae]